MDTIQAPSTDQHTTVRSFSLRATVALLVFTILMFAGLYWRIASLTEENVADEARGYAGFIVNTREWNSSHGGVWVLKTPTSPSNPYLRSLGVQADTSTVSGTQLTQRNSALMTEEMARIALAKNNITFRLTSLKPVNPEDAPDAWERQQLERFVTDRTDVTRVDRVGGVRVLRLVRPLIVETSCLECHGKQGYKAGDVRGAISIQIPLATADAALVRTALALIGIFMLVVVVGGSIGRRFVHDMTERLARSEHALQLAATTDVLTGVSNRRAIFDRLEEELARSARTGSTLGVILMDVDSFKHVNDTHGHAAGDDVLRELTARLSAGLREYDLLGRIGGEEFLVVATHTDADELLGLAERLRVLIAEKPVVRKDLIIPMAVSAGISLGRPGDTPDTLIGRADVALYQAKANGRNRVEVG